MSGPIGRDAKQAVFGGFDGLTSCLGVVAAALVVHTAGFRIFAAVLGLAVAATVGMAAGEYLSDVTRSMRQALIMGGATLVGALLPGIPFAFGAGTPEIIACASITVCTAALIGRVRGYALTFGILIVVAALTVALSVAVTSLTGATA